MMMMMMWGRERGEVGMFKESSCGEEEGLWE
jgi:hypothetical protein